MILTYKYRLKGKRSCRQLRRMAWAVNQVWNYCVATQRAVQHAWSSGLSPRWPSHVEVADELSRDPGGPVGIDLGLKSLATLSTGEKIEAPRTYRLWEDKLIIAQRANKAGRVRALHDKIANVRRDHLHKLSTRIVREYGVVYVGDVSSSQLGRTRMAKSVYDAGWSTLRGMLRYKASRHGVKYAEVDEFRSTQICSHCGDLPPERPRGIADLGMREWVCSSCGTSHDRDVNAAKNILATGLSAQPLAEGSRVAHGR